MRTFLLKPHKPGEASSRFWNIDLQGAQYVLAWGRVGEEGQTKTKQFASGKQARRAVDRLVARRLFEGCVETTPSPHVMLERALAADDDDLAAHSAYADLLMEDSNPRGELVRTQLQLEDPCTPEAEKARLKNSERQLLMLHAEEWLGDAARFFADPDTPNFYEFARGWVDHVLIEPMDDDAMSVFACAPIFRLLRKLEIVYDLADYRRSRGDMTRNEWDMHERRLQPPEIMKPLIESPYLTNLRVFKLGFVDARFGSLSRMFAGCHAHDVFYLLERNRHLEELHLNTHLEQMEDLFAAPELEQLRALQYFNGRLDPEDPLPSLAANAALKNLTTLRLVPAEAMRVDQVELLLRSGHMPKLAHLQLYCADEGEALCQAIVDSGILSRLTSLDLSAGGLSDAGAQVLARCPDLPHLKFLGLGPVVGISQPTLEALRSTGVRVSHLVCQHLDCDREVEDEEFEGDME